jgi:hypothetical protein
MAALMSRAARGLAGVEFLVFFIVVSGFDLLIKI